MKWQRKQIRTWAAARELLPRQTCLPENTQPTGSRAASSGKTMRHFRCSFGNNGWLCAQHVCECLYIISPGKCHARGWAGAGSGWVAVNPSRSPGLLCLCSLSDSQAFPLFRWRSNSAWRANEISTVVAVSWLFSAARTRTPQEPSQFTCPLVLTLYRRQAL